MLKRIIHLAAAGSVGLMIGGQTATAGIFHKESDDERTQVSPACHPTFGYHQTCWRRFPPVPPCDNCDACQDGTCVDGSCQTPIYQPQPIMPMAQPDPTLAPDVQSGRYHGGYSAIPGPMSTNGHEVMNSPGTFPIESSQPVMGGHSTGGRYGQSPAAAGNASPPPLPPVIPAPSVRQPAQVAPQGLPPVPSPADHQSSRLFLPSQPQAVTGNSRYGLSARRQAALAVNRSVQAPTPQRPYQPHAAVSGSNRYRSVSQSMYRMANTQATSPNVQATTTQLTRPVATPLLKMPVNRSTARVPTKQPI